MADPFLGEIRCVGFNFAPQGWATCDGQILSIAQNTALFSLAGTNFGGNGQSTFGLPNLQGSAPMFWGQGPGLSNYDLGQSGGSPTVPLSHPQLAQHNHTLQNDEEAAKFLAPNNNLVAGVTAGNNLYNAWPPAVQTNYLAPQPSSFGGNQPHNNMAPFLTMLFVIALQGIYPTRP